MTDNIPHENLLRPTQQHDATSFETRALGVVVLLTAAVLCGANVYFIIAHPQGCRALTVPLIATLLFLGWFRWRWQLLLFVFLAPLLYWLPTMEDTARLRLARMMFPFVLLPWGVRLLSDAAGPLPDKRLCQPLLLYVALVFLSAVLTLWRYYPLPRWDTVVLVEHELVEANRATFWNYFIPEFCIAHETVVYITGPLFILLLLQSADAALLSRVRAVLLCSLTVAASVGVWQKLTGVQSLWLSVQGREELQRIYGTLGDANTFGAYLALLLPLTLVPLVARYGPGARASTPNGPHHQFWQHGSMILAALVVLALLWTTSRAAWIAAAIALGVLARALLHAAVTGDGRSAARLWRRVRWAGAISLACAALALFVRERSHPFTAGSWHSAVDVFVSLFNGDQLRHELSTRWTWWKTALRMGTELPLTGVGVGNYRLFSNPYRREPGYLGILGDPHNNYLKPFSELGVPGLALFLWICWSVWRTYQAHLRSQPARPPDLWRLAAAAGLLGLAVDILFQHTLVQSEMQVIVACVVALAVFNDSPGSAWPPTAVVQKRLPKAVAGIGIVVAILWFGRFHEGEPRRVLPRDMEMAGIATRAGHGVDLGDAGSVSTTFDMNLGRALVLVEARGSMAAGEWPRLVLTVDGDLVGEWLIDSEDRRLYRRFIFAAPGPKRIQVQLVNYFRDPENGTERKVHLERISVVQGHRASYFGQQDPGIVEEWLGPLD